MNTQQESKILAVVTQYDEKTAQYVVDRENALTVVKQETNRLIEKNSKDSKKIASYLKDSKLSTEKINQSYYELVEKAKVYLNDTIAAITANAANKTPETLFINHDLLSRLSKLETDLSKLKTDLVYLSNTTENRFSQVDTFMGRKPIVTDSTDVDGRG